MQSIQIGDPALKDIGHVLVFLPPGYERNTKARYPVFYLLHGNPGRSEQFNDQGNIVNDEDILVSQKRMSPMILVMPDGPANIFTVTEWANGYFPGSAWEDYVATDLVNAIDKRYRTIANGSGRALGGPSDGGFGALNIGIHHPSEFKVLESWSGYMRATNVASIYGGHTALLARNSPMIVVKQAAAALRVGQSFVWFYCASVNDMEPQNAQFNTELGALAIAHQFSVFVGPHNWTLWRHNLPAALIAASAHLAKQ